MTTRAYLLLTLLLISYLGLHACSETQPINDDRVSSQFNASAINIGYLHGSPVRLRNSAALAAKEINILGGILGKEFNIIYNQIGNSAETVAKAIPMMDDYDIQAIVSTTSSRTLAILEEARPRQVLMLSESATSPALTSADDDDLLFRTVPSDVYQGKVLAQLAIQQNAMHAAFVYNQGDSYGEGLAQEFETEFNQLGGLSLKRIAIPDPLFVGFDDYLPLVYGDQPDVVILSLVRTVINANFINESSNHNFQGFYLFPDVAVSSSFVDNLADTSLISGSLGVSPSVGDRQSPEYQYFAANYLNQFGTEIQNFNSNVYDAFIILGLAIEHAGLANDTDNPSGRMIAQSMRQVMNPDGVKIGPSELSQALGLLRAGHSINYSGAYSNNDFDGAGDIVGALFYDTWQFNQSAEEFELIEQLLIDIPVFH